MSRMDKYEDNSEEVVLSREIKNQDMYKDVYLNNTFVDYGDIDINVEKEQVVVTETKTTVYEEKNYDINEYLKKAHENRINDNVKRSLDDTDCEVTKVNEKEDEISKLIASIEEKEKEEQNKIDFFDNLMPDDYNNTVITDNVTETKLQSVIDDKELEKYEEEQEDDGKEDFKDVISKKNRYHSKNLPLIVFSITLILLILVVILIFVLDLV